MEVLEQNLVSQLSANNANRIDTWYQPSFSALPTPQPPQTLSLSANSADAPGSNATTCGVYFAQYVPYEL